MTRHAKPAALLLAAVVVVIALGGTLSPYNLDLAVTLLCYLAVAMAWNVLGGFGGQVSLGAAAFVGSGGYACALSLVHTGISWELAIVLGGVAGGALATALAIPLLRLRGDYFAVGTLAAAIALQALVLNWRWAGGAIGVTLPFDKAPSGVVLFRAAVIVTGLSLAAGLYVKRSSFGLRLTAVRDDEQAASGLGVSAYRHRLAALILSSVLTGLAGAVIAIQSTAIQPEGMFAITWSLNAVLMTIVGGAGTFFGPIVGVLVVYYGLTKQFEDTQTLSSVIEGVLLIVIVRFAPLGIWPLAARHAQRLLARTSVGARHGAAPVARGEQPGERPHEDEPQPLTMDAEIV